MYLAIHNYIFQPSSNQNKKSSAVFRYVSISNVRMMYLIIISSNSTSSTTSTLSTATVFYVSSTTAATACTGRKKRRAVITDLIDSPSQPEMDVLLSKEGIASSNIGDEELKADVNEGGAREARLLSGLLYWITTTTTSTSTTYTATTTIATVVCTPAGAAICPAG